MIKAVLFDHDGTLVDSEQPHFKMWQALLLKRGIVFTHEDYTQSYMGMSTVANAKTTIEKYALDESVGSIVKEKESGTIEFLKHNAFPLMPWAMEAIEYIHQRGLKVAIVTGAGARSGLKTIAHYHLDKYLSTFVSADDVAHTKPEPDCYELALSRLGIGADECVAIEDTVSGATAAIRAGITCVGVSGLHQWENAEYPPNFICKHLSDACKWIVLNHEIELSDSRG